MLCFANTKLFRAAVHLTVTGLEHDYRPSLEQRKEFI